jgi:hypothetical protein
MPGFLVAYALFFGRYEALAAVTMRGASTAPNANV